MGGGEQLLAGAPRVESNLQVPEGTPDWMAHLIRTMPYNDPHPGGHQFNPKPVETIPTMQGHLFQPSGSDLEIMAALQRLGGGMA